MLIPTSIDTTYSCATVIVLGIENSHTVRTTHVTLNMKIVLLKSGGMGMETSENGCSKLPCPTSKHRVDSVGGLEHGDWGNGNEEAWFFFTIYKIKAYIEICVYMYMMSTILYKWCRVY